eukprot:gene39799-48456_t
MSSSIPSEPEFMVTTNDEVDPKDVKIPYMKDVVKQEIYAKHITNPKHWSIHALAKEYSASKDRVKAIVLLMHERCGLMRTLGLLIDIEQSGKIPKLKVRVPKIWQALYDRHMAAPEESLSKLLTDYNASVTADEDKASMNEEELKNVLDNVKDHHRRLQNLRDYEEDMDEMVQDLRQQGYNTHFREVPLAPANEKFQNSYFPQLLNDEEYESQKKWLLKKAEEAPKEEETTLEQYDELYRSKIESSKKSDLKDNPSRAIRWKLAFRDLTKGAGKKAPKATDFIPTSIRTRSGSIRKATPLEEAVRSWNRRPLAMDFLLAKKIPHFAEKLTTPYSDFDKDDQATAAIARKKAERVKAYATVEKK